MKSNLRATIDIGSNSILLLIGSYVNNIYQELENESNVTGLGKGLDSLGEFTKESMDNSFAVLKTYKELVANHGLDSSDIIATATEASRVSKNAKEFYNKVKLELGINVQIITSAAEAYYSTKGIMFNSKFEDEIIHIMDIGGASTEIIKYNTKESTILIDYSMPMGAVRVTNWLEESLAEEKIDAVLESFKEKLLKTKCKKLFCVAGTMTSLGNMYLENKTFKEDEVHGLQISTKSISDLLDRYINSSSDDLLVEFPFLGKRAHTIHGGLLVATNIFQQLGVESVEISTYGLRYGTFEEGFIQKQFLA